MEEGGVEVRTRSGDDEREYDDDDDNNHIQNTNIIVITIMENINDSK